MVLRETTRTTNFSVAFVGVTAVMVCLAADPALSNGHVLIEFLRSRQQHPTLGASVLKIEARSLVNVLKCDFKCFWGAIIALNKMMVRDS